jgi:hypothetical protein
MSVVRIGNCSGFYGDRLAAARELVEGAELDVLTGDWLAELTMMVLAKDRERRPGGGWARTFLTQMEQVLGTCLDRGIRVVANAGGLNPAGCADAVRALAGRLGLDVVVGHVEGDDLLGSDVPLRPAPAQPPVTANAYLGGWGITSLLERGAQVVVTGRVTDAALVSGPAAWWHGWDRADFDRLAGAVVAGHVLECGAQATGGNYAFFFPDVPGAEHVGFPIAEVAADGSAVITKPAGSGGLVSVGTVTAQLVYEIAGPRYLGPDVVARFDTVRLEQVGPDRVGISGTRGEPPPADLKVAVSIAGGYRNAMTLVLTGLEVEAKADLAERAVWDGVPGGRAAFADSCVELLGRPADDPGSQGAATAFLRIAVSDPDEGKVGRAFSAAVVQTGLAGYPGLYLTSPPTGATAYGVHLPALVEAALVEHRAVLEGEVVVVPPVTGWTDPVAALPPVAAPVPAGPTRRAPLGLVAGARSGDKGGDANVGIWVRTPAAYAWLDRVLTVEGFRALVGETAGLPVERHALPNLLALNFVVRGLLGRGAAANLRVDAQAKGLGEFLRARHVDIPQQIIDQKG